MISRKMRDVLIEHIDGNRVEIQRAISSGVDAVAQWGRTLTFDALVKRGFLRPDGPGTLTSRPRYTVITEAGRAALAETLADWAEALVLAGYSVRHAPLAKPERQTGAAFGPLPAEPAKDAEFWG